MTLKAIAGALALTVVTVGDCQEQKDAGFLAKLFARFLD